MCFSYRFYCAVSLLVLQMLFKRYFILFNRLVYWNLCYFDIFASGLIASSEVIEPLSFHFNDALESLPRGWTHFRNLIKFALDHINHIDDCPPKDDAIPCIGAFSTSIYQNHRQYRHQIFRLDFIILFTIFYYVKVLLWIEQISESR